MQVFDLHFNPKTKEDTVFDSFCYEPENLSEKKLGNLYMVGQLSNALPHDAEFLQKLAQVIKTEYYSNPQRSTELALRESLRKTNNFLAKIAKEGKVRWLGNLNFIILSIKEANFAPLAFHLKISPFLLNFAQTGEMKILLLREREILDISQNLDLQGTETYPLKIFENTVYGKLTSGDRIVILTKNIFEYFKNKDLIRGISRITDEKVLNEILKPLKKELSEISGVLFFVGLTKKSSLKLTSPFFKLKAFPLPSKIAFNIKWSLLRLPIGPSLKKKVGLVLLLISILIITFFLFKEEREKELRLTAQILAEVRIQKDKAENLLIFNDEAEANLLLQSAWSKISPLANKNYRPLQLETKTLKESIEKDLTSLNQLEKISNPELISEIPSSEINLIPQEMLIFNKSLYLFNPFSANIYKLVFDSKEGSVLSGGQNLKLGTNFLDSILFFSKPNILIQYFPQKLTNQFKELTLELPSLFDEKSEAKPKIPPKTLDWEEISFAALVNYGSNLYFLDSKSGEIIKYSLPPDLNKNADQNKVLVGEVWLNNLTGGKKPQGAKSMAIDGNIWILNSKNEIDKYYKGKYTETLSFNFFPFLENPTKIWTSFSNPYLYILEPKENRIVILTKYGKVVRQYQSEKFDNLLDFAVSEDYNPPTTLPDEVGAPGKTIYLLNSLRVYRISFE